MGEPRARDAEGALASRELVHTLRNHLALIVGLIELVLEETQGSDPRRADLLQARDAASAAATLVAPHFTAEERPARPLLQP